MEIFFIPPPSISILLVCVGVDPGELKALFPCCLSKLRQGQSWEQEIYRLGKVKKGGWGLEVCANTFVDKLAKSLCCIHLKRCTTFIV